MIITLKDGSKKQYPDGIKVMDIALDISEGLARVALGAKIDGKVVEMNAVVDKDCTL
ncbi:MAG: TGS domain-containing protein, partial [Christensenellales bacterium]